MSSDHVYCDLGPGDQNIFGSCHDTHNSIPAKPVIVLSVRGMPKCSWSCRIIDPRYAGTLDVCVSMCAGMSRSQNA